MNNLPNFWTTGYSNSARPARPGHWDGREDARARGAQKGAKVSVIVRKAKAEEAYVDLVPTMKQLHESGKSLRAIADALNADGHTTRRGVAWNQVQVKRVLDRSAN